MSRGDAADGLEVGEAAGGGAAEHMDGAAPLDEAGLDESRPAVSPATYWRRRAVALAVCIGLLTILAWAVNGTLGNGATSGHAGSTGKGTGSAHGYGRSGSHGAGHSGTGHGGTGHDGTGHGDAGHGGAGGITR